MMKQKKILIRIRPACFVLMFILLPPGCAPNQQPADHNANFARVQSALVNIPGVTIENSWLHRENSQREFGFDISYYQSELIRLIFPESNNLYQFTEDNLKLELEQLIKSEAAWIIN